MKTYIIFAYSWIYQRGLLVTGTSKELFSFCEDNVHYFYQIFPPFTKFEGNKSEHLGQLLVTPEMIAKKIKKMKDNKSPGVDGIPLKLLKEIVEQISTPLAKVFKLSLEN